MPSFFRRVDGLFDERTAEKRSQDRSGVSRIGDALVDLFASLHMPHFEVIEGGKNKKSAGAPENTPKLP